MSRFSIDFKSVDPENGQVKRQRAEEGGSYDYRIGTVTKLTGLSADVVRIWERRYGAIAPRRTTGGTRLYSGQEVARLRKLKQALDRGYKISQVARLPAAELSALVDELPDRGGVAEPYALVRERFLEAVKRMDVVAADLELSQAATLFHARTLVNRVVAPILAEVGERWAQHDFSVAHEHIASGLLRNLLSSLFRLYPPAEGAVIIVLATPAGERHEFGLLLAALMAAARGWRVVYLGTDLPAADIVLALRLTKARFLGLSLVVDDPAVEQELKTIARGLPDATRVWVGGAQAAKRRDLLHQLDWVLISDPDDFDDRLRR